MVLQLNLRSALLEYAQKVLLVRILHLLTVVRHHYTKARECTTPKIKVIYMGSQFASWHFCNNNTQILAIAQIYQHTELD